MGAILHLRRHLPAPRPKLVCPSPCQLLSLEQAEPETLHAILSQAYRNGFGTISPFAQWWPALTTDTEFDPALVFIAADQHQQPIGLAQCWTSGFIKDVAALPEWQGKGIGATLLYKVFAAFHHRGLPHVDLKVDCNNLPAVALYRRLGMVEHVS